MTKVIGNIKKKKETSVIRQNANQSNEKKKKKKSLKSPAQYWKEKKGINHKMI